MIPLVHVCVFDFLWHHIYLLPRPLSIVPRERPITKSCHFILVTRINVQQMVQEFCGTLFVLARFLLPGRGWLVGVLPTEP